MTRPNIQIPKEFAINGEKADFTQEKMQTGFDKLNPDIFAGDNINKFIDDTYKGLNGVLDLYNGVVLHEMTTTYDDKAVVGKFIGNSFKLYRSLVNDNTGHEVTEIEYWKEVPLGGSLDDKITNCITEIPQDIKLELNNGVLTLKAGSKIYVPNGFEADGTTRKFDEIVFDSDLQVYFHPETSINTRFLVYNVWNNTITGHIPSFISNTQGKQVWWDEPNNKLYCVGGAGTATTEHKASLPLGIITNAQIGVITSIDQVFNGFGYIGSTVFVTKGVKCLIPNGRNEDGSLNNIEFVTDKVSTSNFSGTSTNVLGIQLSNNDDISQQYHISYIARYAYYEQNTKPQVNIAKWFDTANNQIYYWNELETPYKIKQCTFGTFTITDDHITSFNPKLSFRAVDYNEFNSTPHIVDTYSNGNSWYRVWSDGWCEQGGAVNTGATGGQSYQVILLKPYNNNLYNATTASNMMAVASVVRYNTYFIIQTGLHNISHYIGDVYWSTAGYIT